MGGSRLGSYQQLVQELRLSDEASYRHFLLVNGAIIHTLKYSVHAIFLVAACSHDQESHEHITSTKTDVSAVLCD